MLNRIFKYVDTKWDPFDFVQELDNKTSDNIDMASSIASPFKLFIYALTFFVLLFVPRFRGKLCRE